MSPPLIAPPRSTAVAPRTAPPTADEQAIGQAIQKGVQIQLGDAPLTKQELLAIGRDPSILQTRYGISPNDFFAVVRQANQNNATGQLLDLRRSSETTRLYDGVDNNIGADARALVQPGHTSVQVGTGGAFDVRGSAVDAPEVSIWQRIADVLIEIFTLGFKDTRTFNGVIDRNEWQNHGATIAMAGGTALRHELETMGPERGRARLEQLLAQANPDLNQTEVRNMAASMYDGAMAVYARTSDAQLDTLHRAFTVAGPQAFSPSPGEWLNARTAPGAADTHLTTDLAAPHSPGEVSALLALSTPEFSALDAATQTQMSQQLFNATRSPELIAGYRELAASPDFAALRPQVRTTLLDFLAHQSPTPATVKTTERASSAIAQLDQSLQAPAADLLAGLPAGSEQSATALLSLLDSRGFHPPRPPATDATPLLHVDARRAALTGLQSYASSHGGAIDPALVGDLSMLSSRAEVRTASPEAQQAYVRALLDARSPEARASILTLTQNAAFRALPMDQQRELLERFAAGGPQVQAALASTISLIDGMAALTPPLSAEQRNSLLSSLVRAAPEQMAAQATALGTLVRHPGFARLGATERASALEILRDGAYSAERSTALSDLLSDTSFIGLSPAVRGDCLTRLANVRAGRNASNDFNAMVDLVKDNDFARLPVTEQRQLLRLTEQRTSAFIREVRYLIGADAFHSASPAMHADLFSIATTASRTETIHNSNALLRDAKFTALTQPQREMIFHSIATSHWPATQIEAFTALPPATFSMVVDQLALAPAAGDARKDIVALATSPGFLTLSVTAQREAIELLRANPSRLSNIQALVANAEFQQLTADPEFAGLTPAQRQTVMGSMLTSTWTNAQIAGLRALPAATLALVTDQMALAPAAGDGRRNIADLAMTPGFERFGAGHQRELLETLRAAPGTAQYLASMKTLVGNANFQQLNDASKSIALQQMARHTGATGGDAIHRDWIVQLATNEAFRTMGDADRNRLMRLIGGTNTVLSAPALAGLSTLMNSAPFTSATAANQATMLRDFQRGFPPGHNVFPLVAGHANARRHTYTISPGVPIASHGFHSGNSAATLYTVTVNSTPPRTFSVFMPATAVDASVGNVHTIDEVARGLASLVPAQAAAVTRVDVNPGRNPEDPQWKIRYHDPNHESYMTAGSEGVVSLYPTTTAQSQDSIDKSLTHELGHVVSTRLWGDDNTTARWQVWRDAIASDGIVPSGYARSSAGEDFAESMALYIMVRGTPAEQEMREMMPARFALLERINRGETP